MQNGNEQVVTRPNMFVMLEERVQVELDGQFEMNIRREGGRTFSF